MLPPSWNGKPSNLTPESKGWEEWGIQDAQKLVRE